MNTCYKRLLPCFLENVLTDINTDDALGPIFGHFYGACSATTAEVNKNFSCDLIEEGSPHLNRKFRLGLGGETTEGISACGRNSL